MLRSKTLGIAAAITGALGLATAANAAPLSPAPLGPPAGEAQVETIGLFCGPGYHLNRWGDCRPNFWGPRPFYRPYGYGYGYRPRPFYRPYGFYGPRPFF